MIVLNKSILLGALTGTPESQEKLIDMVVKDYAAAILERIYLQQQFQNNKSDCEFRVITSKQYKQLERTQTAYNKFKDMQNGKTPLPVDVEQILNMKSTGMSNRTIANQIGVSEGTIRNRLRKNHVTTKKASFIIRMKPKD